MMKSYKISAVVCTHNRDRWLQRCLVSLIQQTLPSSEYEILVVDNASTDTTSSLCARMQAHHRNLRYLFEPELGLSKARNAGLSAAMADIIAYLDDDATAADDWLDCILRGFASLPRGVACLGGRIVPAWDSPKPIWLPDGLLHYLGNLDLSKTLHRVVGPSWLGGGNAAYRREALRMIGGFDPRLGRKGTNLLSMEDTAVQREFVAAGLSVFYDPSILIYHSVDDSRLTQQWFTQRAFWEGISDAYARKLQGGVHAMTMLLTGFVSLLYYPKRLLALLTRTQDPRCFHLKCTAYNRLGFIWGMIQRIARFRMLCV